MQNPKIDRYLISAKPKVKIQLVFVVVVVVVVFLNASFVVKTKKCS